MQNQTELLKGIHLAMEMDRQGSLPKPEPIALKGNVFVCKRSGRAEYLGMVEFLGNLVAIDLTLGSTTENSYVYAGLNMDSWLADNGYVYDYADFRDFYVNEYPYDTRGQNDF